jgi:hypothetical protein
MELWRACQQSWADHKLEEMRTRIASHTRTLYTEFNKRLEKLCEKYAGRVTALLEDVYKSPRDVTLADSNGTPLARVWVEWGDPNGASYVVKVRWVEYV